jgi:hypothetical protein
MLVSGDLPSTASLPAQAELSVPAGSELQWIGEILGGDPTADPALKYAKTTVGGSDIYRFTLTKSRTAQIEVPIAQAQEFDGTAYSSAIAWTATQDVPEVRLSLRVPQAAQIATPQAGAALTPGDAGYAFYSKTFQNVKSGDPLELATRYSIPAVTGAAAGGAKSSSSSVVPIVLVLLVLAAFGGLVFAVRRKMTGVADEAYEFDAEEDVPDRSAGSAKASGAAATEKSKSAIGSAPAKVPLSGKTKRNLVTVGIIAVLIVVAVVVGMQTTRPQVTGETITQTFASGDPCANAVIPIAAASDADPRKTAETLFAAIKPIPGLTSATYNSKTKRIDIGYCESSSSELALRQALAPTGLVAAAGMPATPAP